MSEKEEVRRDGGRLQRNSGRGILEKGDATLGLICYDIKEYTESFSVSRKVWAKISTDAFKSGRRIPALKLVLGEKDSTNKLRLWVVSDAMFHEMFDVWEKHDE